MKPLGINMRWVAMNNLATDIPHPIPGLPPRHNTDMRLMAPRVLVVEDEMTVALLIEDMVSELAYEVAAIVPRLEDAMRKCGVEIDRFPDARREQKNAAAYLELHIEQGPVLEGMGMPLGVVLGTKGVERHAIGSPPHERDVIRARGVHQVFDDRPGDRVGGHRPREAAQDPGLALGLGPPPSFEAGYGIPVADHRDRGRGIDG